MRKESLTVIVFFFTAYMKTAAAKELKVAVWFLYTSWLTAFCKVITKWNIYIINVTHYVNISAALYSVFSLPSKAPHTHL